MSLKKYKEYSDPQLMKVQIGDHFFELEICQDHTEGLSNTHTIEHDGMIFIFPSGEPAAFHMKACNFPLDILFGRLGVIDKIYHNCPPCHSKNCEKYSSNSVDHVIELPGGTCEKYSINIGDPYKI